MLYLYAYILVGCKGSKKRSLAPFLPSLALGEVRITDGLGVHLEELCA